MKYLIQMCGDPTVDWIRIHDKDIIVRGGVYYWKKQKEDFKVRLSSKPGGSAMVLQFLKEMIPSETALVEGTMLDEELLNRPKENQVTTSWTVWRKFPNPGFNHQSFRLEKWHEFEPGCWDYSSAQLKGQPDLLVIQDSGLGFRECREGWPEVLADKGKKPRDIIIKLGQYNENKANPLLDRIAKLGLAEKTTIVTALSDLRSCSVKIGISLSWERILEEVVAAVFNRACPFLNSTGEGLKYKQIIVTIGASGIILIEKEKSTLIFDRSGQEGDFAARFPGQMVGYHTCILGTLAASWIENPGEMDWVKAGYLGMKLARLLHIKGYKAVKKGQHNYLQFPNKELATAFQKMKQATKTKKDEIERQISDLGVFAIDNETLKIGAGRDCWTILEENLLRNENYRDSFHDTQRAVNECAKNIITKGPLLALPDVPVEVFGDWTSADRQEIEGVRNVNNAMKDYCKLKNPEKPLSVAVFGPPGAGKSFVVKEIAKGLGIKDEAQLTFNLSQFESPDELRAAFSEIRDLNLKGIMPLVFWDEFDNPCEGRNLGWLRYFLAPMQDGEYTDRGVSRPLGGGIHVFAGATRHSFEEFQKGDNEEDRAVKKPDFTSRLRAYINIRGINGNPNTVEDRLYMIRRAFALRQYLKINAPQICINNEFAIEDGVLEAFLRVTKYTHGARSMENLIKMSSLADKRKFELSSLPPDNIIKMHVNVNEFNSLTCTGPRQILRIGIAGHNNLASEQMGILESAIDEVVSYVEKQFADYRLTAFSTLAPGAERMLMRRLLRQEGIGLIAVLPVARSEYINQFGSTDVYGIDGAGAEMRQEFKYLLSQRAVEIIEMAPSPTKKSAYLKAGHFIAENSDILIVLWDGNEDQNSSLTARIVAKASEINKPICHIMASNNKNKTLSKNKKIMWGKIEYKNLK